MLCTVIFSVARETGHVAMSAGRLALDQRPDSQSKADLARERGLDAPMVHFEPRYAEPTSQHYQRYLATFVPQASLDLIDLASSVFSKRASQFFLAHSSSIASQEEY